MTANPAASSLQITRQGDGSFMYEFSAHGQQVLHTLNNCRNSPDLTDITIAVSNEVFRAHKPVLIACSDYFRNFFAVQKPENPQQVLELSNINLTGFQLFLDFAYTSRLSLSMEVVQDVLSAAVVLKASSVMEACCEFLKSQLTADNCVDVITIAETYGLAEIKRQANRMMCERLIELSQTYKQNPQVYEEPMNELNDVTNQLGRKFPLPLTVNLRSKTLPDILDQPPEADIIDVDVAINPPSPMSSDIDASDIADTYEEESEIPVVKSPLQPPQVFEEPPKVPPRKKRGRKPLRRSINVAKVQRALKVKKEAAAKLNNDKRIYCCKFCNTEYSKLRELRLHYGEAHSRCTKCTRVFRFAADMERHMKSHQRRDFSQGPKRYVCTYCGRNCGYSSALKIHIRTHTGEKPFVCQFCDQRFIQSINLRRHILTNHEKETPYECKTCGKKFSVYVYLKSHEVVHSTERPYQCETCGAMFKRKSDLRSHNRVHVEEKPHKCDICHSHFKTQSDLKTHQLIHNDDKPHKCDKCGASFKRTGHLNRHMQIHSSQKPFQCETCGAQFNRRENLRSHQRIHSGEQPYKCKVCNAVFRHMGSLKIHEKNHEESSRSPPPAVVSEPVTLNQDPISTSSLQHITHLLTMQGLTPFHTHPNQQLTAAQIQHGGFLPPSAPQVDMPSPVTVTASPHSLTSSATVSLQPLMSMSINASAAGQVAMTPTPPPHNLTPTSQSINQATSPGMGLSVHGQQTLHTMSPPPHMLNHPSMTVIPQTQVMIPQHLHHQQDVTKLMENSHVPITTSYIMP
ncbi:zinc finger protein 480-like [Anneissia japonica]|uniref:zinc finger protein 480-like n=1 Tax=Anneissia japonica TaxID=1529436 RepID=UPI0014258161|nr:zinc finger protein 480-like [Anneissia japonica]XP_033102919.1 zinc finger protein 480-like [Anneissia japonica]